MQDRNGFIPENFALPRVVTLGFDYITCTEEVLFIYEVLRKCRVFKLVTEFHYWPNSQFMIVEFSLGYFLTSTAICAELTELEKLINYRLEKSKYSKIQISLLDQANQK